MSYGSPTWADLVHQIRIDPDSDEPRLVAADYLSDRGDPRGEYIVRACQSARCDRELEHRAHFDAWRAPLTALGAMPFSAPPADPVSMAYRHDYRRGFVDAVAFWAGGAANFSEACRLEPIVALEVNNIQRAADTLARAPELAQIRTLQFGYDTDGIAPVLASPLLGALRELGVSATTSFTPMLAEALGRGAARPARLQGKLDLATVQTFVERDVLRDLTVFDHGYVDDQLLVVLAAAPLTELRTLTLWAPALITGSGLLALGPRLARLEALTITSLAGDTYLLDRSVIDALTTCITGGALRDLVLGGFSEHDLIALVESPVLAGVERLRLGRGFTVEVGRALARSPYRSRLRSLAIHHEVADFPLDGVRITRFGAKDK
ncbi:MAG: TIGR02996 domain-containing protein [Deltaproteobacteria bacterium]|nr:TIGR02996 domain-containing protein [Deltaproteobacteria bacterium]